jgi:hypothetical protein
MPQTTQHNAALMEASASEIADLIEHGGCPMVDISKMYVRAIQLLREYAALAAALQAKENYFVPDEKCKQEKCAQTTTGCRGRCALESATYTIALDVDNAKLPPPELTWLYTHCRAIGMTCKSDSEKWEHDMALFTSNLVADRVYLVKQIEELKQTIGAKQAEIDRLMLEYCPNEMTAEQTAEWATHQRPVSAEVDAQINEVVAAMKEQAK